MKMDVSFRRFVRSIPPVLIALVLLWSNISFTLSFCAGFLLNNKSSYLKGIIVIVAFQFLSIMSIWSFLYTCFSNAGRVVKEDDEDYSEIPGEEESKELDQLGEGKEETWLEFLNSQSVSKTALRTKTVTCKSNGDRRFCRKCDIPKADRCHHCSVCNSCILKMDHHCIWVGNCIGFRNYKSFFLFLMYSLMVCLFVATSIFSSLFSEQLEFRDFNIQWIFLVIASILFGLALLFLFTFHVYLICMNLTTIEKIERGFQFFSKEKKEVLLLQSKDNPFNLGLARNVGQFKGYWKGISNNINNQAIMISFRL